MTTPIVIPFRDTNTQKNVTGGWRFYLNEGYLEVFMDGSAIMKDEDLGIIR